MRSDAEVRDFLVGGRRVRRVVGSRSNVPGALGELGAAG